jgi:hypothetical protein
MTTDRHVIKAAAQLMRARDETGTKTNSGRWALYDGGVMECEIPGISPVDVKSRTGELLPVYVVVDLATFSALDENVIALKDHDRGLCAGSWSQISMTNEICASLELATPSQPGSLIHVTEIKDLLAAKAPLQASIDARPSDKGRWEPIDPGTSFTVNGRTLVADPVVPTFILRHGYMKEASIVTFGACENTGRIAASRSHHSSSKDSPMSTEALNATFAARLKKLCARFTSPAKRAKVMALLAAEKSDEEISAEMDEDGAGEMAALTARCEAAEKALDVEQASHHATKKQAEADKAAHAAEKVAMTAAAREEGIKLGVLQATSRSGAVNGITYRAPDAPAAGVPPKTITEAMKAIASESGCTLKGYALHAEALRRYPNAERA